MEDTPTIKDAPTPGACPEPTQDSVGLSCKEIWGGNKTFYGPVELPGVRGVLYSQPCGGSRGGDVHYLSVCGSGLLSRVCLADVVGHGESVAAVSQVMHDQLRRSVDRIDERKVLRRLNLRLSKLGDDAFTTAAVLTYFPPTRRMSISYAGHEPAWYYVASTQRWLTLEPVERKGLANLILAVSPRSRFTRCVRRVTQGDRLLMITDGVLEAMNRAGALFGRERLAQVIQSADSRSPETVVSTILDSLHEHTEGAGLNHDDVSILLLEFVDNLEKPALWLALQNRLFRRRSSPHHAGRSSMGNDGLINGGGQVEAREEASVNRALLSGRTAAEAVLAKAHEI